MDTKAKSIRFGDTEWVDNGSVVSVIENGNYCGVCSPDLAYLVRYALECKGAFEIIGRALGINAERDLPQEIIAHVQRETEASTEILKSNSLYASEAERMRRRIADLEAENQALREARDAHAERSGRNFDHAQRLKRKLEAYQDQPPMLRVELDGGKLVTIEHDRRTIRHLENKLAGKRKALRSLQAAYNRIKDKRAEERSYVAGVLHTSESIKAALRAWLRSLRETPVTAEHLIAALLDGLHQADQDTRETYERSASKKG